MDMFVIFFMKNVLYILIILIFISCDFRSNDITNDVYDHELAKADSVSLDLAVDEYGKSYLDNFIKTKDSSLLFRKSRYENTVTVYDWERKKRIKKIKFSYSGPNGIESFEQAAFMPIDKEHYFIGTVGHIYETLGDSVIQHVKPKLNNASKKSLKGTDMFFINGQNHFAPFRYENSIYAKTGSLIGDLGTDDFYDSSQLLKYDLRTKEHKQVDLSYPHFYYDNCWGMGRLRISYSFNPRINKLIYFFPVKPMIYTYDLEKEKVIDSVFVKNKFYSKLKPISCSMPTEKKFRHYYTTPSFERIVYDKYKDVYYMFATLPISVEKFRSVDNPFGLKPFSILVLDNKFNIIAERRFKGGIYFTPEFFVTEKGLWISKYNPFNEEQEENILVFDLFKLQEHEDK